MPFWNQSTPNPRNQATSATLRGGADSDSICKDIDAEDLEATTLYDLPAVMDSAPTPNVSSVMPLWNSSISNLRNQAKYWQDWEEELILIPSARMLMLRMQGQQHNMSSWIQVNWKLCWRSLLVTVKLSLLYLIINFSKKFKTLIGFDEMGDLLCNWDAVLSKNQEIFVYVNLLKIQFNRLKVE